MSTACVEAASTTTPSSTQYDMPTSCDLPYWHRNTILFVVSWMTLVATFSSTSLLSAVPEIALTLHTTLETINITNAGVIIAMGASSLLWLPIERIVGRWYVYNAAIFVFCVCSAGAAAAPDLGIFIALRLLGGSTGTYFMIAGQTILAEIFEPEIRGTATGFFMAGSVSGPAIGPCIGGVIVTLTHWRVIYWLQVAMAALGLMLSIMFVPRVKKACENHPDDTDSIDGTDKNASFTMLQYLAFFNPKKIFRPILQMNVLFADLTCGFLAVYQYTLLTSVRSIINPRFNLTSPLVSGLFYIAPGTGFLIGSIIGGKMSDCVVKRYIAKRNGVRLPQDRLNSGLLTLLVILPAATLIYGWTLQKKAGGLVVPIISAFGGGAALMGSFNALNTYTAEVLPRQRTAVISGKYIVQYTFAAAASATVVPLINSIGIGLTFTISMAFSLSGGVLVLFLARRRLDL